MAEPEVATKAPESDAQAQEQEQKPEPSEAEQISGIEGDTKPDQGAASMGVSKTTEESGSGNENTEAV